MKAFLITIVILLLAAGGWYYYQQTLVKPTSPIIQSSFSGGYLKYTIDTKKILKGQGELEVVEVPTQRGFLDRKIYFYFDTDYPILGSSTNSVLGVYNHMLSEFQLKNLDGDINIVNSSQLKDVLNDKSGILVMASGVLPDTIFSSEKNLLTPWLKTGGTLIWVGDGLGYYYGVSGAKIESVDTPYKIGWSGQKEILGDNYLDGDYVPDVSGSFGDTPSNLAKALGIKSKYTQTGAFISALAKHGGSDLGYAYNFKESSRTSLARIKIGTGSAFIFGSPLLNREIDVAWDISQIFSTGILDADTIKVNSKKINTADGNPEQRQIYVGNNKEVRVTIFGTDLAKRYFYTKDFSNETSNTKSNSGNTGL